MVLIFLLASIFSNPDTLLHKYQKVANKELKKNLSIKVYDLDPLSFEGGELYLSLIHI